MRFFRINFSAYAATNSSAPFQYIEPVAIGEGQGGRDVATSDT